ncbi:MAG: class I SAM-dependent methyltransferase [bacterium]|nr:class I SAM-dependent methyltransferase [bacterium]
MANCKHVLCRPHEVCGQIVGDKKNPGGNIYTPGQLHTHKEHQLRGWPWFPGPLKKLAGSLNEGVVVEIGVFGGASLLSIVEACQKNNTIIYGIDPWEKINTGNGAEMSEDKKKIYRSSIKKVRLNLENIIKCEKYSTVKLMHDFSKNVVSQFADESIDILLIDGDHSYDSVLEDLSLWWPKVKKGGTVWGDDFNLYSVRQAAQDFCEQKKLIVTAHKGGRAWEVAKDTST